MYLGRVAITEGAYDAMARANVLPNVLLARHQRGEQGDISPYAFGLGEEEIAGKPTSLYLLSTGEAIWITTDSTYSATEPITTLLLVPASVVADL